MKQNKRKFLINRKFQILFFIAALIPLVLCYSYSYLLSYLYRYSSLVSLKLPLFFQVYKIGIFLFWCVWFFFLVKFLIEAKFFLFLSRMDAELKENQSRYPKFISFRSSVLFPWDVENLNRIIEDLGMKFFEMEKKLEKGKENIQLLIRSGSGNFKVVLEDLKKIQQEKQSKHAEK